MFEFLLCRLSVWMLLDAGGCLEFMTLGSGNGDGGDGCKCGVGVAGDDS